MFGGHAAGRDAVDANSRKASIDGTAEIHCRQPQLPHERFDFTVAELGNHSVDLPRLEREPAALNRKRATVNLLVILPLPAQPAVRVDTVHDLLTEPTFASDDEQAFH